MSKIALGSLYDTQGLRLYLTGDEREAFLEAAIEEAGIEEGPHRSPKGLGHAYGVHAVLNNVPLNMLKKWMGHVKIETTAIYAEVVGQKERDIAARMWAK